MAKPNWLTAAPLSGSGNGTVNISAATHTGRSERSGSLTFKAPGVTDVIRPVTQKAKPEFVTIANVSALKGGGNVTISGKSNSNKLAFTLGAGSIPVTLPATYQANGAATNNNTAIAGDPGALAEFDFSITVAVPKNETITARSRVVTVTAGAQTANSTISQEAGDPVLSVSPASFTLEAAGTAVSGSVVSNTNWTVE